MCPLLRDVNHVRDFKISSSVFTATDLGKVAGIDRKLVDLWLERELIKPTHVEPLAVRNRPMFTVVAIFKARLTKILSDTLAISTSGSMLAGMEAERASKPGAVAAAGIARLAQVVADEGWMWAVARSVERDKPLALLAAISRSGDCWQFFLEFDVSKFTHRFGPEVPFAIVPVGAIFASVYRQCKEMYDSRPPEKPRNTRRAQS